jgi:hypothetical protein
MHRCSHASKLTPGLTPATAGPLGGPNLGACRHAYESEAHFKQDQSKTFAAVRQPTGDGCAKTRPWPHNTLLDRAKALGPAYLVARLQKRLPAHDGYNGGVRGQACYSSYDLQVK